MIYGALMDMNSVIAKGLVELMIPVTSCLTREAKATDPTRAMDLAKIYDLIGGARTSGQKRTQPARRPSACGKQFVETNSPGGEAPDLPKSGSVAKS